MALLEIKNLKKYYPTSRGLLHAVDDVTLNIEKGKTIGIVGESGCGKSTLGKTLLRLYPLTAGKTPRKAKSVSRGRRSRGCPSGSSRKCGCGCR